MTTTMPDHATDQDDDATSSDPASAVRSTLETLVASGAVSEEWATAVAHIVTEGAALSDRHDVRSAHLVQRVLRSEATIDALPPERLETATAPDLRIRPEGDLLALPDHDDERYDAFLEVVRERTSTPLFGQPPLTQEALSGVLAGSLQALEMRTSYRRRDIPRRVFPTAGGLQPIDCHVIANRVEGLEPGVYTYDPVGHGLVLREGGDLRTRLLDSTMATEWVFDAPAVLALVVNLDRVLWKYGSRGYRYSLVDNGVVVGQIYLAATALGLSVNAVAAFGDDAMNHLLRADGVNQFANVLVAIGPGPSPA